MATSKKEQDGAEKPKRYDKVKEGYMRKTYIVNTELAEKVSHIAYWERLTIVEAMENAMQDFVTRFVKKNGPVKKPGK